MNELNPTTTRRSVLQKGLLCVAGAFGLQLAPRDAQAAESPPPPPGGQTLVYYSSSLRARTPGQQPGKLPTPNGRLNRHAALLDRPDGKKVGEFTATRFGTDATAPANGPAGFHLELQTLHLPDGTLFGIGSGPGTEEQQVQAIVGGTGRFAGAKGSYVLRRSAQATRDGSVEFVITLLT